MSENELEKKLYAVKVSDKLLTSEVWTRLTSETGKNHVFSCVNDHIFLMRFFGNEASSYGRIFGVIFEVSKIYLDKNQENYVFQ